MAKTRTQENVDIQDETKKQRKKQAKEEARLMLKLEQAKRGVQKAEQKAAKVRSKLEVNEKFVQEVEQKLAQLRETQPETVETNGTQQEPEVDSGDRDEETVAPDVEQE